MLSNLKMDDRVSHISFFLCDSLGLISQICHSILSVSLILSLSLSPFLFGPVYSPYFLSVSSSSTYFLWSDLKIFIIY